MKNRDRIHLYHSEDDMDKSSLGAYEQKLKMLLYEWEKVYTYGDAESMCTDGIILNRYRTGARVYEISNIRVECVDLQSGLICFKGKGNKERYVQIGNQEVLEWMREYYLENKKEIEACGFFFVNNRGGRFTEQSIRLMLKKYTKAAGIRRNITPHMFRHSFATYLIEEGVDVSCIQRILGHSSIKTTQIYIHVAARKQAEILQQYHPRNAMKIKVA